MSFRNYRPQQTVQIVAVLRRVGELGGRWLPQRGEVRNGFMPARVSLFLPRKVVTSMRASAVNGDDVVSGGVERRCQAGPSKAPPASRLAGAAVTPCSGRVRSAPCVGGTFAFCLERTASVAPVRS